MQGPIGKELFEITKNLIYAHREEPFVLASGRKSHHYFNCKKITMHPAHLAMLADALRGEVIENRLEGIPSSVGGLTMGADPIAYALSLSYREHGQIVYPLIVRKEAKDHGTGKQIEGEVESVDSVLLLDDVITTGGSSLKAAEAFRKAGLKVTHAVCIIDREEGGRESLEKEGITLFSLYRKSDFGVGE